MFESEHNSTVDEIEIQLTALRAHTQSQQMMIVIDDCQRLGRADQPVETRLQIIAEQLQQTALKFNLPVLATWTDLETGSGALAQRWGEKLASPDVVLVMERDSTRSHAIDELHQAITLHVVKNRGGEKGCLAYDFVAAFAAFTEVP